MTDSVSPPPTASSSPPFSEKGKPQPMFNRPTLGHAVRLGELFDERRNKFLSVQLYKEEAIRNNIVITDNKHTDLTLSQSNSVQDRSNALDINASLSLNVLSGLIPARGSASQVIEGVKEYFTPVATHFVSGIVYGGNGGVLKIKLDRLKGALSLKRGAAADVKSEFTALDNKFDLEVYSDIELNKTPLNAKDVLYIAPYAGDLICRHPCGADGGAARAASNTEVNYRIKGVPISVTLQTIPAQLRKDGQINLDIFWLKPLVVFEVLSIFSELEDLCNRFTTLVGDMTKHQEEFIPKLVDRVQTSANAFYKEHFCHLQLLGQFLEDIQHGDKKKTEVNNFESSSYPKAKELYTTHMTATGTKEVPTHEFPLIHLEKSFRNFQDFVHDISLKPSGLEDQHGNELLSRLSTIDDVDKAFRHQSIVPLFLMTPSLDHHDANSAVIRFLALLCNHKTFHPRYLVYLEDTSNKEELPHDTFLNLNEPAYFLGKVNDNGNLTWTRNGKDSQGDFISKVTNRLHCLML
ncbi:hypothetical protein SCLCIDRAFT_23978 [Scleroderma citrinum Foug A]|uniref:Uncharacterized protein n=1 Tax=Scleroderma citrinum Foug A TaxID=1036808 RepID=A0A0C3DT56_9AGAM|nr:hypothetical protein SCLCIDRAFT_23978 [Scleroderma citrinum Foug A]